MGGSVIAAGAVAAASALAWSARGRSSNVFGPSVWQGRTDRPFIALTFDDGPSAGTIELLEILQMHGVRATFFMCGANVRRNPHLARAVVTAGHEPGNHTDTHPRLWLRRPASIRHEIRNAQQAIVDATGVHPALFRAPYGVRWFGLREAQQDLGLLVVMWTTIGRDWVLPADRIVQRMIRGARNGAILCLHDGRTIDPRPDIRQTVTAVRRALPALLDAGWQFRTAGELIGYSSPVCPKTSSSG